MGNQRVGQHKSTTEEALLSRACIARSSQLELGWGDGVNHLTVNNRSGLIG